MKNISIRVLTSKRFTKKKKGEKVGMWRHGAHLEEWSEKRKEKFVR